MVSVPPPVSGSMNAQYLRSNFVSQVNYKLNGKTVQAPDFFDPVYLRVINALTPVNAMRYNIDKRHIPGVAFDTGGNTSCFWLLMAMNGFIHPLQIDPCILLIPNYAAAIRTATQPTSARTTARQTNTVTI